MPRKSRILIVGGGGVGAITGLNLEASGQATTTFVLCSNYEVVAEKGFDIISVDHGNWNRWLPAGGVLPRVPDVLNEGRLPFDFIICCTKNIPDVPPALAEVIRPAVTLGHTVIVLVQNGLNIERPILQEFSTNICLSGVSFCGAEELWPGHVVQNGTDRLDIGTFSSNDSEEQGVEAAQRLVRLYAASGKVEANFDKDVRYTRWRKLLINAVYNPISALTLLDTSQLRLSSVEDTGTNIITGLLKPAMEEIIAVAKAVDGVVLERGLIEASIESDPIEAFIAPSMQQDVQKGRFIEYKSILGAVVTAANKADVQTPTLNTLHQLCKALQFRLRVANNTAVCQALVERYRRERL